MILQGRETPTQHRPTRPEKPERQERQKKPAAPKPAAHKPSKPAAHKPSRPSKPERKGKRTAGRGELDLIWFDDTEFKPLATGGHIH